jgi:hypothetical protein
MCKSLKGEYYNNGNFMAARNKRNSSHAWRAILYGSEALNLGLIKKIGDGGGTRVWEDLWIPTNPGLRPLVPRAGEGVNLVQELLNPSTG